MNCVQKECLQAYMAHELSDEERIRVENHIASCDFCLQRYVILLDACSFDVSAGQLSPSFTDHVMARIVGSQEKGGKKKHMLIHYVVAAGCTLFLMFSGAFDHISSPSSSAYMAEERAGSFSTKALQQTIQWLHMLQLNDKEDMER